MNRAHARRRYAAWRRYERRWPQGNVRLGTGAHRWWIRARKHRTAYRGAR